METVLTVIAAVVVGAALSVSGAVLQSLLRNPLAEPYMLGIVGGGALFAVLAMNLGLVALGAFVLPLASFLGSCFALALVCLIAWCAQRHRTVKGADPHLRSSSSTLIVAGYATGAFLGSLDLLALSYAEEGAFVKISKWLYGRLDLVSRADLIFAVVTLSLVFAALFSFRRELNVMELGHDEAECLGVNTRLTLAVVIGSVALATAVSVALAGAVGFVGLVVPHFVRRVFGPRMQVLLPVSALLGGLALVFAEFLAQRLPGDVGVGVICAIFGAPFFLFLLASSWNGEGRDI